MPLTYEELDDIALETACMPDRSKFHSIAVAVKQSQRSDREIYAKQIEEGKLYGFDGLPISYWHCQATIPPDPPKGRDGCWKASAERPSGWNWIDYGPKQQAKGEEMLDFNGAPTQRDGEFDLIPDGTIVPVQMTVRPGNAGPGGWLKRSNSGECLMVDAEFVVIEGKYAKRKVWSYMTVDGQTDGQKKAVEISIARLRAMLESARGIRPDDESTAAQECRKISGYDDFDGIRFWVVIGVEKGQNGYKDKNTVKSIITPDRTEWSPLNQPAVGNKPSASVASAAAASSAQATRAAGANRPSWAS